MSLRRASSATLRLVHRLRDDLTPLLGYSETSSGVWADFTNREKGHKIARLRPSKSHIVAYLKLDREDNPALDAARTDWDFPSTFTIRGESDLPKAMELILLSNERYAALDV